MLCAQSFVMRPSFWHVDCKKESDWLAVTFLHQRSYTNKEYCITSRSFTLSPRTMKHFHFLRIAILTLTFIFPSLINAQQFLNGSFEHNGNLCLINSSTKVFNANVKNTFSFGKLGKPDIASSDCGNGNAKDGNWFVGLAANIQG